MRKKTLIFLSMACLMWACENEEGFAPTVQQIVTGQTFTVATGEQVHLPSDNLTLTDIVLEGWHARGFVGPNSTAKLKVNDGVVITDISISHNLQCEFEFVGKGEFCDRDAPFFTRLDSLSNIYSSPEANAYAEVAQLAGGLKLYMLLVETDHSDHEEELVKIKSAEFVIKRD